MALRYTIKYTLLFAFLALLSRYDIWLDLPPSSIHQWRQADGASIAWHYAQQPDFSEVRISNLFHTGDNHAVGELPLLYWFSGLVSHYGGFPKYPLRWIGLLILFSGVWTFGWVALQITKHPNIAVLGAGLLLTSPILSYYGPSFLPDAPAFCFILMMLACLFQANQKQSRAWLCPAAWCAILAISLKLSMAITPLAFAMTWILGKWRRTWSSSSIWNSQWPFFAISGVGIFVLGFRYWVAQYNAVHQATYFLASTRPIWRYDWVFIQETITLIGTTGLPLYASAGLYLACLAGAFIGIKHWELTPFAVRKVFTITILGSVVYALLWFRMLREHDYYVICLLVIPVFLLLNGFRLMVQQPAKKYTVQILGLLLVLGIGHNYLVQSKRLDLAFQPRNSENLPPDAFLSEHQLTEAGIPLSAKILCPQDPSPNIALLALKRLGWTAYNFGDRITADTLTRYQSNFGLSHLALRDTTLYSPLYRHFFPIQQYAAQGWHIYSAEKTR